MATRRPPGSADCGVFDAEVRVGVCHTLLERQCPYAGPDRGGAEVSCCGLTILGQVRRLVAMSALRELHVQRPVFQGAPLPAAGYNKQVLPDGGVSCSSSQRSSRARRGARGDLLKVVVPRSHVQARQRMQCLYSTT